MSRRIALTLLCLVSAPAWATASAPTKADPSSAAVTGTIEEQKESPWIAGELSYDAETNLAETASPRLFSHSIELSISHKFEGLFTIGALSGIRYQSLGNTITTSDGNVQNGLEDVTVSIGRDLAKLQGLGGDHTIKASLADILPVSESSRLDGVRSIPRARVRLISEFFDKFVTLDNRMTGTYVINTYSESPGTHLPNPTGALAYRTDLSVEPIKNLSLSAGFGVKRSQHTDGYTDFSYQNEESIDYKWHAITGSLSYTNGGYTEDGRVQLWYIDQYRQVVSAGIKYEF